MGNSKVLFVDEGTNSSSILDSFLSQELSIPMLTKLIDSAGGKVKSNARKPDLIEKTVKLIEAGRITPEDVLRAYVRASRMWLSFKTGSFKLVPKKQDAFSLLKEFGKPGWYGPIQDELEKSYYYIYVKKVIEPLKYDEETNKMIQARHYRWSVIAKVSDTYAALSWYGFGCKENPDRRANQFPFWKHIPNIFDELSKMTEASWKESDLYNLVLEKLWRKYLDDVNYSDSYDWRHLRIKAESSGVALNAKSSPKGPSEMSLEGLLALADALASSAFSALVMNNKISNNFKDDDIEAMHNILKSNLLKTLIKDWGAIAYEFQLDRLEDDKSKKIKIFRAYCNFGIRDELGTEDSLQHLKCFSDYGNSNGTLDFLLKEMKM